MAEAGKAHGLLNTFLGLKKSHRKASMNITSDSDGHLQVTIKVTIARQAGQAPMVGGRQSSRQERGPGSQAPPPAPPAPPAPPTPPAPARRARNRGPGALLRDKRRRLGRIQPGIFEHVLAKEVEGGPALPHHALPPPPPLSLVRRGRKGAPPPPPPPTLPPAP